MCPKVIIVGEDIEICSPRGFLDHFGFLPDKNTLFSAENMNDCLCLYDIGKVLNANDIRYERGIRDINYYIYYPSQYKTRKLLPLSAEEIIYLEKNKEKFCYKYLYNTGELIYEFDFWQILHGYSRYIGYWGDKLDEIEDILVESEGCNFDLKKVLKYMLYVEKTCATKEMYNLAFNLKNIRENIILAVKAQEQHIEQYYKNNPGDI